MPIVATRVYRTLAAVTLACALSFGADSQARESASSSPSYEEPREYRLWYRNFDSPAVHAALRLAFDKTPEYGAYRITRSVEMVQGRALLELHRDPDERQVDIANVATSPAREESLYTIALPIDGGLLGFRVCVVRKDRLDRFQGSSSIADLVERGLSIGQGAHWPDADILRANGVPVVTHTRYETLFTMLAGGRFDCFARGVSEVLYDLERVNRDDLAIEPDLLLAYPMPSYFFVGPRDHDTAQRIQLGLERAIEDGSFARFLADYYGRAVEALNLEQRQLLILKNPFLSADSAPVGRVALENLRRRIQAGVTSH
ncbi:transporter substrate-binding domain-containing protein [Marinobacter sp. AN1]|uniref:transporter substrate-binding domain-containing protein n=1 Tax=Marinobacter sp. AN1 TaxID=2886046 RepID=UPI00223205C4|nr:transporter substrate-binding domain-containing protein [Marinobacter sp. AN1]UZD64035.1 transporter substrate-binding domain-containing protein [Marinobacter sp. AN1]